jgi:preprotein translocase subunit SecF
MRERTELVRTHTRRVNNRRKGSSAKAASSTTDSVTDADSEPEKVSVAATPAPEKPVPGAKPSRPTGRPSGKRNTRR